MPSFKKRVHSERKPQHERPAVTPYEGSYDEKYSSDEEVEYVVDEPDDVMERSNSTVTFSEDVYDSDTIDEMIKSQMRKSSQISQEGSVKSEDVQGLKFEAVKQPKSILKDGKGTKSRGSLASSFVEPGAITAEKAAAGFIEDESLTVSSADVSLLPEDYPIVEEEELLPGKDKKDVKGEKLVGDVTKPLQDVVTKETDKITDPVPVKGEREVITKSLQSTIPKQIDQITDKAATNQDDFAEKSEQIAKSVTKPLRDTDTSVVLPKDVHSEKLLGEATESSIRDYTKEPLGAVTTVGVKPPLINIDTKKVTSPKDDLLKRSDKFSGEVKDIQPTGKEKIPEKDDVKLVKDASKSVPTDINTIQIPEVGKISEKLETTKEDLKEKTQELFKDTSQSMKGIDKEIKKAVTSVEDVTKKLNEGLAKGFDEIPKIFEKTTALDDISKEDDEILMEEPERLESDDAVKQAKELIDDITRTVEEVLPKMVPSKSEINTGDVPEYTQIPSKFSNEGFALHPPVQDTTTEGIETVTDTVSIEKDDVFKKGEKFVADTSKLLKDSVSGIPTAVTGILDKTKDHWKKEEKVTRKNTVEKEVGKVSKSLTEEKDDLAKVVDDAPAGVEQFKDVLKDSAVGVEQKIVKPLQETITKEKDHVTDIAASVVDDITKKGEKIVDVAKPVQKGFTKGINTLSQAFTSAKDDDVTEKADKMVEDITKPVQESLTAGTDTLSQAFTSAKDDVTEKCEDITKDAQKTVGITKDKIDKIDQIEKQLLREAQETGQKITVKASGIFDTVKDKTEKATSQVAEGVNKLTDNLEDIENTEKKVSNGFTKVTKDTMAEKLDKVTDTMLSSVDDAAKKAEKMQDDFTKAKTSDKGLEEVTAVKDEVLLKCEQLFEDTGKSVKAQLPKISDKVTGFLVKAAEDKDELVKKPIRETVESIKDSLTKTEGEMAEGVSSKLSNKLEKSKDDIVVAKSATVEGVKDDVADVQKMFSNGVAKPMKDAITAETEKVAAVLSATAKDVSEKDTLIGTDVKDDLAKASDKIASDIARGTDTVKDKFGKIEKKVEKEIGKPLQKAKRVTDKLSEVGKMAEDEFSEQGEAFSDVIGRVSDDVTTTAEKVEKTIQEGVGKVSGDTGTNVEDVTKQSQEEGDEMGEVIELTKKDVTDKAANGFAKGLSLLSDTVTKAPGDIIKISEKVVESVAKPLTSVLDVVPTTKDELSKESDKTVEDLARAMSDVGGTDKVKEEIIDKREIVTQDVRDYKILRETMTEDDDNEIDIARIKPRSILSDLSSGLSKTVQGTFTSIMGKSPTEGDKKPSVVDETVSGQAISEPSGETTEEAKDVLEDLPKSKKDPDDLDSPDSDSKPRVIFRIESEDEMFSDVESDLITHELISPGEAILSDEIKEELKATLEKEKQKLEERLLPSIKGGIFDISDESLSKTKELVDERLRKISEIKPPKDLEESVKKEPAKAEIEEIKIGRFHITPALVEEVVAKSKESEIAERLKTTLKPNETEEGVEKELSEKLTEADFEEVIRELKLEGLKTDVYFQPVDKEKEEKKERTLKRVERRFERMASETLEQEKEEADSVSEEKLDEKREVEFQRMLSQLSSEEVAEYQQEYLQLWEDGGLSSLTPTDDWESRDPDTPENELELDSPRKPESFRGSHGIGKNGGPIKTPDTLKKPSKFPEVPVKSRTSPPKPVDISPTTRLPMDRVGPSPSETDRTSGSVPEPSDEIPSYDERKKFWEQMSSSQSSESTTELSRSMIESVSGRESVDSAKKSEKDESVSVKSVKQIFEKDAKSTQETRKTDDIGLVKSLTDSYSKKIAAGELVMPAIPRPKSIVGKESPESEIETVRLDLQKLADSPGTAVVSELELKLKSRSPSAPITDDAVISGSTELKEQTTDVEFTIGSTVVAKSKKEERKLSPEKSTDSEAEFLAKYGVESVAFDNTVFSEEDDEINLPLSERKKIFEGSFDKRPPPVLPARKTIYERSMSLPAHEVMDSVKAKKRYFEGEMEKEIMVEQIMGQATSFSPEEILEVIERAEKEKSPERKVSLEIDETAASVTSELIKRGTQVVEEKLEITKTTTADKLNEKTAQKFVDVPRTLNLKEIHVEKSETEDNEKEKAVDVTELQKREDEVPSITVSTSGRRQVETSSIGESEDTQSESDVTPEEARVVDNGDAPWDGSGIQSGGFSPKDDIDYPKELGETGIGRWIGQEDLSKQNWEKDDLDSSHFKIQTKWERTRSEGASPKEHYVYTPEEHYPDTVWEVPVQEQLEKEEMTHDIPIEKQVIIEKDEEEEEEEEEQVKKDVKKFKLTEEEAKEIAKEVLEYIQFEVENRASFLTNDIDKYEGESITGLTQSQVTDYLRHLADDKDLDEQDVQLIESVLIKKQFDQTKKPQIDTTASSIDITDEDLRSSGADNDISPVESQITKLQNLQDEHDKMSSEISERLEKISREELPVVELDETTQTLKDVEIVDQTIAEVKESLEAAQEQLIEQHKKRKKNEIFKKESPSEFEFKGMSYERIIHEAIEEQTTDWERVSEYETITEEGETSTGTKKGKGLEQMLKEKILQTETKTMKKVTDFGKTKETIEDFIELQVQLSDTREEEVIHEKSEHESLEKKSMTDLSDEKKKSTERKQILKTIETKGDVEVDRENLEKVELQEKLKKSEEMIEKVVTNDKKSENFDIKKKEKQTNELKKTEISAKDTKIKKDDGKVQTSVEEERELFKDSLLESEKSLIKTQDGDSLRESSMTKSSSAITETSKSVSKSQKVVTTGMKVDDGKFKILEIGVPDSFIGRKMDQRYSSEDSPRSTSIEESMKSPPVGEEMLSSTSSVEKQDGKSEKSDIVFRHSSSSSINALLKADNRRSGTDLEPYSSSGESHYHSFEQTTSRPCSSDVEVLLAGNVGTTGSSEYESAISQDTSSKQATSMDYHTAVSSLSSRESIKSLDSESSGHLGSVEVSSEASETLIPSALELDKDIETPGAILLDDENPDMLQGRKIGRPPPYMTQMSEPTPTRKASVDEDFEVISESEVAGWAGETSEDEEGVIVAEEILPEEEHSQKMKRSYEMTFQPEPKPIAFSESLDNLPKDSFTDKPPSFGFSTEETMSLGSSAPDERFCSSLEESGSVLSMSLSTASEPSVIRTVIELSRTDSDKMDGSLTYSATSIDSASREDLDTVGGPPPQPLTNEMSTSTVTGMDKKTASVTITTSSSHDHGIPSVSTQVTSVSRKSSMVDDAKTDSESSTRTSEPVSQANGPTQVDYVAEYDEVEANKTKKTQGHRRKESTSNFVPTMMWNLSEARTQKVKADISEIEEEYTSDKYVYDVTLTEKEVKNDEKKEADDSEKPEESCDPGFELYALERKISEGEEAEEFKDFDNRPQSQTSRTDSESGRRPVSSIFSEDRPDSELSDLMKQGSSETEKEDPLERPMSPEPEEMENKDITPEFSSEAQASVTELEMEYSGAYSRRDEYASHVSPIREERSEIPFREASLDEMDRRTSGAGLHSQASLESTIAEKHELETGEKEILQKKGEEIPDITVTEHMTPVLNEKFQYPVSKEEPKDKKTAVKTPDTPASTSSRTSSTSTDQGKEYNLDEVEIRKMPKQALSEEKEVNETKEDKESLGSPSSDSFEMLDKPDISDEYVIIEEVGREAQENDAEGRSVQIAGGKKKVPKRVKQEQEEVEISPPAPATKMTELKYFPEDDSDLFSFESESPPQPPSRRYADKLKRKSSKEEKEEIEYDLQIEQSKKWVEMQFQGEQPAKVIEGYEMEYGRGPLEDIKEEDLNELDSSSKIGSMGSQKESLGSFGSVKDSFSSTPDYDVLAGKKYFSRSGDHDDVSMSSLQEFELIEKKIMENGKKSGSSSSQDSLSSKKLGTSSKSGQGDDISLASLREFENLEHACATVVKMETKAKQEEAILSEIDEGHESQISESESCETVSAVIREKLESDSEDFDKRMLEIDEIIRQAQSHVEKFPELHAMEKIESMGRGDSYEEVAKVPDLELDMPLSGKSPYGLHTPKGKSKPSYSTQVVVKKKIQQWRETEGTDNPKPNMHSGYKTKPEQAKSDLLDNGGKIKSISADSLEIQAKEKQMMLEGKDDTMSLDSYKRKSQKSDGFSEFGQKSDSMEEISTSLRHHESSSGDYSSSGREDSSEHTYRLPPRSDFMLGSTDSLDPSSSTATHATYQYETDSVMSSSFTSGDSNTMVSSTDNLDLLASGQSVMDLGVAKADDWLENLEVGDGNLFQTKLPDDRSSGHRKLQVTSEIQKLSFKGPDADKALEDYMKGLGPEEEIVETEEVDEHGKVHIKKVLRKRVLIRPEEITGKQLSKEELEEYLKQKGQTVILHEKLDMGGTEPFVSETIQPLYDDKYSHIIHKKTQMVPEVEKIVFKGPDAERALKEYMEDLNTGEEIEETEEVDEHGNVHIKRVIRQRVLIKPEDSPFGEPSHITQKQTELPPEKLPYGAKQSQEIQKVTFRGPDAQKQLEEYVKKIEPAEVEERVEIYDDGNVHIKKVLRHRMILRQEELPGDLTKEETEEHLKHQKPEEGFIKVVHKHVEVPLDVQKLTFRGSDADKQLEQYIQSLEPEEVEELKEIDDHGILRIKKVLRRRMTVGQEELPKVLTKEEMNKYLTQISNPREHKIDTKVQKLTFTGPDAQKQLEDYMKSVKPEVEEIEEVDEDGNVHIKKIVKHKMVLQQKDLGQQFTKEEMEKFLRESRHPQIGGSVEVQKLIFTGPDAEKQLEEYKKSIQPEEIEEIDEDGNAHIKRVLRQRMVIRQDELAQHPGMISRQEEFGQPETIYRQEELARRDSVIRQEELIRRPSIERQEEMIRRPSVERQEELTKEELEKYIKQGREFYKSSMGTPSDVQKLTFTGPDAQEQLEEYMKSVQPEVMEEIEEVDEHGNVHIKKILRQRMVICKEEFGKPSGILPRQEELTKEELEKYTKQGREFYQSSMEMPTDIQKLTFTGPDAQKQLEEYMKTVQPEEVEEIEEVDEHGNVHIKKILSQRMVICKEEFGKPSGILPRQEELTKEELEKYTKQGREFYQSSMEMPIDIQKVTFTGPDAQKQLEEYMKMVQPEEVEEIEEVDEHGNVHIKKILRQRVMIQQDELGQPGITTRQKQLGQPRMYSKKEELTKEEVEKYTKQGPEFLKKSMEIPADVQKLTFTGPDAQKQLEEYIKTVPAEDVEETEEVDEHGNVHVKRVIRQRMIVRQEELGKLPSTSQKVAPGVEKLTFRGPDAEMALQEYIQGLGPEDEITEIEEEDEHGNIHVKKVLRRRVVIRPEELGDRELTKEELEDYLKKRQTTLHYEKVDIGSAEPFVSEIIEPLDEKDFSRIIHRKVQMAPEVQKVVFRGPDADRAMKAYMKALEPGEDVEETEEIDEHGNVHIKRVLRRKLVFKPEELEKTGLTGDELKQYLKQIEYETFEGDPPDSFSSDPQSSTDQTLTEAFTSSVKPTEKDGQSGSGKDESMTSSAVKKESGKPRRPPLVSDISMDDEAEYDPTEHDWRHQLEFLHAEADEDDLDKNLDAALASSPFAPQKKN